MISAARCGTPVSRVYPGCGWRPGRRAGPSCSKARSSPTPAPSRRVPARFAPIPDELDPRVRERARARRALRAPGRGVGGGAPRRARDRHDRHRERQDARVQPAGARRARARAEDPRALPLPDEGARAGPAAHAHELARPGREGRDLRRRHRRRPALADPQVGEPDPHEPRHAPRRRAPAPRPVGRRAAEPPLRRRRRGARLPRRVRLARRQRPAPAAPRGRDVRRASRSSCSPPRRSRTPASSRERLLGVEATVVGDDAAPRAERTVVLWNPELLDEELGVRASALGDASRLLAELAQRGLRTICFAKSRKAAELIHRFAADRLDPATAARLAPYRAGYTPQQRREIERRLVEGDLLGVSATDALELGIDIGLLDCAISVGFPGTMASLRQQWGRAGTPRARARRARRERGRARPVLHASSPETLLDRRVEAAILDHANPRVLDGHVRAAAFEAPIDDADRATLGDEALERAAELPELKHTPRGWVWAGRDYPAARVPLRSTSPDSFTVVDVETGSLLGLVERERAYSTVHDGAVYLHLGERYLVRGARPRRPHARSSRRSRGDWYTQAKKETMTEIARAAPRRAAARDGGDVRPRRRDRAGRRLPAQVDPRPGDDRPRPARPAEHGRSRPRRSGTSPSPSSSRASSAMPRLLGTLHAAEHAMIAILPLWAMCDRWDIGGLSTNIHFADRPPHDLRLRRALGRRRDHRARLRDLRGLGRGHRRACSPAAPASTAAPRASSPRSAAT